MALYIPLNLRRKEIDALLMAINHRIISSLDHYPEALLYWDTGRSFYVEQDYFENSFENIEATLTYPNIPPQLRQELQYILDFLRTSLHGGFVKPADISDIRNEMEDYKVWRNKLNINTQTPKAEPKEKPWWKIW